MEHDSTNARQAIAYRQATDRSYYAHAVRAVNLPYTPDQQRCS